MVLEIVRATSRIVAPRVGRHCTTSYRSWETLGALGATMTVAWRKDLGHFARDRTRRARPHREAASVSRSRVPDEEVLFGGSRL
jgi:hypothetical protein